MFVSQIQILFMSRKRIFSVVLLFAVLHINAQQKSSDFRIGMSYGFGSEFNNTDYTFTNHFYKAQLYYRLKKTRNFEYDILVQPEINFGKHQLLNLYFIKPETPNLKRKEWSICN